MNFFKPKQPQQPPEQSKPQKPHLFLQQAFTNLQTHCSNFLQNQNQLLKTHHQNNPNFFTSLYASISIKSSSSGSRTSTTSSGSSGSHTTTLSAEAIEERLAGVPVYALSNSSQEFVLVSGVSSGKSLGLFCFKEDDADCLLQHMKSMDPAMRDSSQVVAVALGKVFQLQIDGVAFRLIPESSQVKHALKERQKAGFYEESFSGVPVFQSKSLILRSQNKRYRPVFFRKEDLEKSLLRAAREQKQLNPAFREGDIQVAVLEDIIRGMKDSSTSNWDDVVFIPPGFDVSTNPSQR